MHRSADNAPASTPLLFLWLAVQIRAQLRSQTRTPLLNPSRKKRPNTHLILPQTISSHVGPSHLDIKVKEVGTLTPTDGGSPHMSSPSPSQSY
ncbi:hypothetical protein QBC34DRAFT_415167 [Podospora aff. communis PSN243]|uniref:Secreted protein n=1 Tax=Podospora aff. communis PSN243 TaxID=3040156 RepID=A0AAV9G8H2_9PEZI|nr:hypothetical protein QBC34DRAFT_415167 [Podospora aff. communis PSN243]